VLVGGELTAEMLDLQLNPVTKYYVAPAQMKANNGVLIIDDFRRQRIRPEELLNRWVVPLDRRIDFLALVGGKKIEVPFEMLVVFASNMDPAQLVDACFLRRIQTKIKIRTVTDAQFSEIFRRVAEENQVAYDADVPKDLIAFIRGTLKQELRQCYPRDIVNQVLWAATKARSRIWITPPWRRPSRLIFWQRARGTAREGCGQDGSASRKGILRRFCGDYCGYFPRRITQSAPVLPNPGYQAGLSFRR
jgi:hypothetical protein